MNLDFAELRRKAIEALKKLKKIGEADKGTKWKQGGVKRRALNR